MAGVDDPSIDIVLTSSVTRQDHFLVGPPPRNSRPRGRRRNALVDYRRPGIRCCITTLYQSRQCCLLSQELNAPPRNSLSTRSDSWPPPNTIGHLLAPEDSTLESCKGTHTLDTLVSYLSCEMLLFDIPLLLPPDSCPPQVGFFTRVVLDASRHLATIIIVGSRFALDCHLDHRFVGLLLDRGFDLSVPCDLAPLRSLFKLSNHLPETLQDNSPSFNSRVGRYQHREAGIV